MRVYWNILVKYLSGSGLNATFYLRFARHCVLSSVAIPVDNRQELMDVIGWNSIKMRVRMRTFEFQRFHARHMSREVGFLYFGSSTFKLHWFLIKIRFCINTFKTAPECTLRLSISMTTLQHSRTLPKAVSYKFNFEFESDNYVTKHQQIAH